MAYVDLIPKPGVLKDVDEYTAGPRWINTEKVRFDLATGYPEKIGGWTKFNNTTVSGSARAIHAWRQLDGTVNLAVGTECFIYVYEGGDQYEITPLRASAQSLATAPFTTGSAGSTTVTVADTSHGAVTGDGAIFTFGTGTTKVFDGITITEAQMYPITYVDANSYTIEATIGAASSGSTANSVAGAVSVDYTLNCGISQSAFALGWGAAKWGDSTWGTARTSSAIDLGLQIWSIDHWGEDLIAAPSGGAIYTWDVGSAVGTRMVAVSNAPSQVNLVGVSPDRHMIAFGAHDGSAYDPLLIRWSDQEDNTTWAAGAANTAGSKKIETGTKVVAFSRASRQIIILTDASAWGMQFVGPPFTFSFQEIGKKCGAVGPKSSVSVDDSTYWMGNNSFFRYNGTVKTIPCTVRDYVFGRMHPDRKDQTFASSVKEFNEIWWFYASASGTDVDSYVVYNYGNDSWYTGTLDRLSWMDREIYDNPIAVDASGQIYFQEDGTNDVQAAIVASCETGVYEFNNGNRMMFLDKIIPAFKDMSGDMTFTIYSKKYPNSVERSKSRTITNSTQLSRIRARGRQHRFGWSTADVDNDWTLGKWRANPRPDGDR